MRNGIEPVGVRLVYKHKCAVFGMHGIGLEIHLSSVPLPPGDGEYLSNFPFFLSC